MDATTLSRLRDGLSKLGQGAVILPGQPQVLRGKKKLSPEALEAIKELQETPKDVFSRRTGLGSAAQSTALGGAVGTGLAFPIMGLTPGGMTAPIALRPKVDSRVMRHLEKVFGGAREAELARRAIRSGTVRNLALAGAGTGLASNIYFQHKRKGLKKVLEQELGLDKKKKKKKKAEMKKTSSLSYQIGGIDVTINEGE